MTDAPLGIARTRNITYREELHPLVEQPALLQGNRQIQNTMSGPVTASLVNLFHNTIDLSTSEGKKLYQKATEGLLEAEKCTGNSKHIIKFAERVESQCEDLGWKISGENIGYENLSAFKTPGTLSIDAVKAY